MLLRFSDQGATAAGNAATSAASAAVAIDSDDFVCLLLNKPLGG